MLKNYRYTVNYEIVESIEIDIVRQDYSMPVVNRVITNKDTIKTIIKDYINKSHEASILKGRLTYRLGIKSYGSIDVEWIGISSDYIKTNRGWFKTRRNLEDYLKAL
jgi:hypothetical protein